MEELAIAYLSLDAAWRITAINAEGRRLVAPVATDVVGQVLWDVFPATVGTAFEEHYRRAVSTGQPVTFDAYYPAPLDGWYEIRAVPHDRGLQLYALDAGERHRAQAAATSASEQVAALGEVALALAGAEDITDLVTIIAERGLAALGADGGSVAVPDPQDSDVLLSYITASFGEDTRASFGRVPLGADLPVALAARTGQRVLLADEAACAALSAHVLKANAATGCQAWASMPLRAEGALIGVLTAGWVSVQAFTDPQVQLLDSFAAQCAQALQRLAARDGERRAAAAARLSAKRQAALVTIAQALASAETQDEVLSVVATHGSALLGAAGSGLCLREENGTHVRTLATDTFDADLRAGFQRVPVDFPMPIVHTAVTGTAHYLPDLAATVAAFPGAQGLYEAAGVQASACVPLRAGERLWGSLSVAFGEARLWQAEEQGLLTAFAALTAQALDRIAAQQAERTALAAAAGIAQTLQRAMLTPPPEPDHLELVVRYTAAAQAAEVGGDWYDAFITSAGLTSVVIGDVTGHDMAAAAVMGQLRNLVRGIGFTLGEPPAAVLAAVDRAAAGLGLGTVATAILAQVQQDAAQRAAGTRLLCWSNAGHLPPLLIGADGSTSYLEGEPDLVLGWDPSVERHDHEVVLEAGSAVLLYTDGLIERRGVHLQEGLDWLAATAAAATRAGATLEQLCDQLLAAVAAHLDDDVALVALRAHPEDAPRPVEAGPSRVPRGLGAAQDAAEEAAPEVARTVAEVRTSQADG